MPRHRIERERRYRARTTDRRVQIRAVSSRPPAHAKPAGGPGPLGAAWDAIGSGASGASDRLLAAGARFRRDQHQLLSTTARGLLVSPWFAAGAGFVVAAGAFIYAPHASLSFGGAIGVTHCQVAGCNQTTELGAPPLPAGTGDGQVTAGPATKLPAATLPAGLTFSYTVTWHAHGMFGLLLTVASKHAIGNWRLAFTIPGATKLSVFGGKWQPSGTDGGTASGTGDNGYPDAATQGQTTDRPSPGTAPQPEAGHGGGQSFSLYVIVDSTSAPAAPTHCSLNGAACHFSRS